ncbi:MAG: ABC transporter permease [Firmicutes bacterium]|nr:ABC transporter permease [Bacillota bacterium]
MLIAKRAGLSVITILFTITVIFFLLRLSPHDPEITTLNSLLASGVPRSVAVTRVEILYGPNPKGPIIIQYFQYLWGLLHGKLGQSYVFPDTPIPVLIAKSLPWTVLTGGLSIGAMFIIGVASGAVAAFRRNGLFDKIMSPTASVISGIPNYLVGTILLYVFAVLLGWFPMQGAYSPTVHTGLNFPFIFSALYHAVLPIGAYAVSGIGYYVLMMKANTVSTLGDDFVTGARGYGIPQRKIMIEYVAPNSILPMVTHVVLSISVILGGSIFVETIFSYPGIGYLFGIASGSYDYALMQAEFLMMATIIVAANFAADLIYVRIDPRIHLEDVMG